MILNFIPWPERARHFRNHRFPLCASVSLCENFMDPQYFDRYLENLEFQQLLELVGAMATFEDGKRHVLSLRPLAHREELEKVHRLVGELRVELDRGNDFSFAGLGEAGPALRALPVENLVLDVTDILALHQLMSTSERTRRALVQATDDAPLLKELGKRFPAFLPSLNYIDARLDPSGEVPDRASPELAAVRRSLRGLNEHIHQEYQRVLDRAARRGLLQDSYVTVRNNRFVIPLRSEGQGTIRGVVHGTSSSGQTVFMEPFELVPLNNRFISQREREQAIILEILGLLTAHLRLRLPDLDEAWQLLVLADSLGARARFGRTFGGVAPKLDTERYLVLEEARHPLLEATLRPQGKAVVPISLELGPEASCLIISGPNTGGKTAALKTAGLLSLAALAGIPVPARHMECQLFHHVFGVVGDQQSLSEDLSTFSSHVMFLRHILENYLHPSLILVDEMGGGTDPEEGAALALAILDHFLALRAPLVVTTHSQALKEFSLTAPGAVSAAVEIHPDTLEPTYQLHPGTLAGSSGLFIARKLGIPESLIQAANLRLAKGNRLSEEVLRKLNELILRREEELASITRLKHEQILKKINLERQAEEQKQRVLRQLRQEFEQVRRQFDQDKKQLFEEIRRQAEAGTVHRMEQRAEQLAAEMREQLEPVLENRPEPVRRPLVPLEPGGIQPGQRVHVQPLHSEATVIETGRDGILVLAGDKRFRVPLAWLCQPPPQPAAPPAAAPAALSQSRPSDADLEPTLPAELHLLGKTAEEALTELDAYLDAAFRQELRRVGIVHGLGRGVLRQAVHQRLRETPFVTHFFHPPYGEGGQGKTIVELDV